MTTSPAPLPSRGLSGFAASVLAGLLAGGLALFALKSGKDSALLAGLIMMVPLPLFLAGLGAGRADGLAAGLVAAAMLLLGGLPQMAAIAVFVVYIAPAMLLCQLALRYRQDAGGGLYWYPGGRLLAAVALYPVAVFVLGSLLLGDQGLDPLLRGYLQPYIEQALRGNPDMAATDVPETARKMAAQVAGIMPGMACAGWMVMMVVQAVWAQYALTANRLAMRPTPSWLDLDLPPALLILLATMGLVGSFYDGPVAYAARNTLLPLAMPFLFVGISLAHLWFGRRKHRLVWLVVFYGLIALFWPAAVLTAMAGVLEPWLHLRRKITGGTKLRNLT